LDCSGQFALCASCAWTFFSMQVTLYDVWLLSPLLQCIAHHRL